MIDLDAKIHEKRVDALSDAVKELLSGMLILSEEVEKLEEKIEKLKGLKERVDAIDDCMDDRIVEIEELKRGISFTNERISTIWDAIGEINKESKVKEFRFVNHPRIPNTDNWRGLAEVTVVIGGQPYQAKRDHAPYRERVIFSSDEKGVLSEESQGSFVRLVWESTQCEDDRRVIGFIEKIGYVVLDPSNGPNRYCIAYRASTNFPNSDGDFNETTFLNLDHLSYTAARGWLAGKWNAYNANET